MKRLTGQKQIQRSPKSSMLEKRLPESSVCVVTTDYLGPPSDCRQCFPFYFFFFPFSAVNCCHGDAVLLLGVLLTLKLVQRCGATPNCAPLFFFFFLLSLPWFAVHNNPKTCWKDKPLMLHWKQSPARRPGTPKSKKAGASDKQQTYSNSQSRNPRPP